MLQAAKKCCDNYALHRYRHSIKVISFCFYQIIKKNIIDYGIV